MLTLNIYCRQCNELLHLSFNNTGIYEYECSKGHKGKLFLSQEKFELMFDIGAYSVKEGYYREAIFSFTASLERFYETFVETYLYDINLDDLIIENTRKNNYLSERQTGSFVSTYAIAFKKSPKLLNNKLTTLRNEVVHKGKIPSYKETIQYGQNVLDIIHPIINEMKSCMPEGMSRLRNSRFNMAKKLLGKEKFIHYINISIISFSFDRWFVNNQKLDLEMMINYFSKNNWALQNS